MLKSISWHDFLYVICLTVGGYYVISTLLLYSREIVAFLKGKKRPVESTQETKAHSDIIGQPISAGSQHEEVMSGVDIQVKSDKDLIVGTVSDLIQDLRILINDRSADLVTAKAILDDVKLMLSNYSFLLETTYPDSINLFIQDQLSELSIDIPLKDIAALWPASNARN